MIEQDKNLELTSRQKEILSLLRKGLTNNEICSTLCISANTVKVHLAHIYKALEVSNRTEAVTTKLAPVNEDDSKKNLSIIFYKKNDLSTCPKAYSLYLSIVGAIHQYRIFSIKAVSENSAESGFIIEVSSAKDQDEVLYISTKIGFSQENLWTTSIKINTDDISFLAQRSAMQLFRSIVLASAKLKYSPQSPIPYWWYISTSSIVKLENRSQEAFINCKNKLTPLVKNNRYNEFILYVLAFAYYMAIIENWGNTQCYIDELCELARKAMVIAPYSIYSQMIKAFYNIVLGNKSDAVMYLKQVIDSNPQSISARSILIQIYMLTGQEEKALELTNECSRLFPESAFTTFISPAKVFILLLQQQYEECKKLAKQFLLFSPKALAVRLILIACCNITDDVSEGEYQTQKLFEYNPNVTKKDVEQLLKGVSNEKKMELMNSINKIFESSEYKQQNQI